ncbi:MAG TPA: nuclear transport factor 2 family protein [Trebonia sp.]|jgi:ketosteroid isomerase-like protein|nr:nuclear transport factor 2 family protein [Trebonia sp.]
MTDADAVIAARIRELEDRRYQAMTDADVATLDELLAPDLVYTHSNATRDSKQGYLDRVASRYFDYGPLEHPVDRVVVHGDCALVIGDMRGEVKTNGEPRSLNSAALAVWARAAGGQWLLLAFQPTKYPA